MRREPSVLIQLYFRCQVAAFALMLKCREQEVPNNFLFQMMDHQQIKDTHNALGHLKVIHTTESSNYFPDITDVVIIIIFVILLLRFLQCRACGKLFMASVV